jgi:hypothetical protein
MSDICYACGAVGTAFVKIGMVTWDLCGPCTQTAIPNLIIEDTNNTLTSFNSFGQYGILGEWAKNVVFEIPKQQALYEKPHSVVLCDPGIVLLMQNGHLAASAFVDGNSTQVYLENIARNNCDVRGTNMLLDVDKFLSMTQSLSNAARWREGAQFLKDVEESFTVIGSFVQN